MFPLRIRGCNVNLSGEGLPKLSARFKDNIFYTAWEPSPDEIELLQHGGRVIIACAGIQPYMVVKAIETDFVYEDYKTPYKQFTGADGTHEWQHVESVKNGAPLIPDGPILDFSKPLVTITTKKKRGRPPKIKKEI